MLNAQPQQTPQQPNQQQLNKSIEQARQIMQTIQNSNNQEAMLANFIQNNPNSALIANMLRGGNNLESIACQMAKDLNIDINQLLNQLKGI